MSEEYTEYNGATELSAGLIPKNNRDFPLMRARDVVMPDNTRLDDYVKNFKADGGTSDDSITTTWIFNEYIDVESFPAEHFIISFTSNGVSYAAIERAGINNAWGIQALYYEEASNNKVYTYMQNPLNMSDFPASGWTDIAYRTITIQENTDNEAFITWLNNNAIKTGGSGEMPLIRFSGARGNKGGDQGTEPSLTLDKGIYLTVEIVGGGALKMGDALQLCNIKTYHYGKNADNNKYKKQKLRRFTEYVITEDDLNKKYLTIPVNLLGDDADKIAQAMMHNGRTDEHRVSPIYIRIRRPKGALQDNESGMTVDADFSNIVRITRKYTHEKMHFE